LPHNPIGVGPEPRDCLVRVGHKPGPVVGGHLSGTSVTGRLERPHPGGRRAASCLPYWVLLRVGFTWQAGHPAPGGLLHHHFTLTAPRRGGIFLWHFPWGRPHWTLSSTLPYAARTFLERHASATAQPTRSRSVPPRRPVANC